jgi:hypothetical protein
VDPAEVVVTVFYVCKGGVTKSWSSQNLAAAMAMLTGRPVGVADGDPQRTQTKLICDEKDVFKTVPYELPDFSDEEDSDEELEVNALPAADAENVRLVPREFRIEEEVGGEMDNFMVGAEPETGTFRDLMRVENVEDEDLPQFLRTRLPRLFVLPGSNKLSSEAEKDLQCVEALNSKLNLVKQYTAFGRNVRIAAARKGIRHVLWT